MNYRKNVQPLKSRANYSKYVHFSSEKVFGFCQSLGDVHDQKGLQAPLRMKGSNEIHENSAGLRKTKHLYLSRK